MAKKDDRFITAYSEGNGFSGLRQVLVDRQTGVNYLFVQSGYSGGLCPLLNARGEPVVTPAGYYPDAES